MQIDYVSANLLASHWTEMTRSHNRQTTDVAPVLIAGGWRTSQSTTTFRATNPITGDGLESYPISPWTEIEIALREAHTSHQELALAPANQLASYLEVVADRIESVTDELVDLAHLETALPQSPRLLGEIARTTDQLRQAAASARDRSWTRPTLSPRARIASMFGPIPGAVCVFGPNNFPFAFNSVAGGDFAAAIATRHPVIAKANSGHPGTTRVLAREASRAADISGLPPSTLQLVYRISHEDGARLVSDARVAATAYTGSRQSGLALKTAADAAGKPIYLEMSSVNPVIVLPEAARSRGREIAAELVASLLLGTGQFCTSPGIIFAISGPELKALLEAVAVGLEAAPVRTLLDVGAPRRLEAIKRAWESAGATTLARSPAGDSVSSYPNTMMQVDGRGFLASPEVLQMEAFGNMSLVVEAKNLAELGECIAILEGNLTGSIYSAEDGHDDEAYTRLAGVLRQRVGRLLNDKVPTGVAVVPAMNHGGPYPSTAHPGFTAVGVPASLNRFGQLMSYDNVRDHRLPEELQSGNPLAIQRYVDGSWTTRAIVWGA